MKTDDNLKPLPDTNSDGQTKKQMPSSKTYDPRVTNLLLQTLKSLKSRRQQVKKAVPVSSKVM